MLPKAMIGTRRAPRSPTRDDLNFSSSPQTLATPTILHIASSSEPEDEADESFRTTRTRGTARKGRGTTAKKGNHSTLRKKLGSASVARRGVNMRIEVPSSPLAANTAQRRTGSASKKSSARRRTYGGRHRAESDKENAADESRLDDDSDVDDTIARGLEETIMEQETRISKLEQVREKFKAVDDWEMDFETVDLGGGDSSSWR